MATFKQFVVSDQPGGDTDVVLDTSTLTGPLWSNSITIITSSFTSSAQLATTTGDYILDVYQYATSSTDSAVQFSIAYGHKDGSGSANYTTGNDGYSPSRSIFGQYNSLIVGDTDTAFTFGTDTANDFFVINVNRNRYKQNIRPGQWNLKLSGSAGGLSLTDDKISGAYGGVSTLIGRQFEIVSGSDGVEVTSTLVKLPSTSSYGYFYPDAGIFLLNARALAQPAASGGIAFSAITSSATVATSSLNNTQFYNTFKSGAYFQAEYEETITSEYYFCRVRNNEFNYSNNLTFIDTSGSVVHPEFINDPQTYISTVGLYNDEGDLLAVAKLSKPLPKDFTAEALIRVKLDF
jgi:hypothetical protein